MPDWQEIMSRDGDAVWRTAYRYLGNRADADECFQEAFLGAWELSRRQQIQNWRALLIRLAAARAVDRLRRQRFLTSRREAPDWEALKARSPSPQQVAEDAELSERLRTTLALLPPRQAEVFCLHCLEGDKVFPKKKVGELPDAETLRAVQSLTRVLMATKNLKGGYGYKSDGVKVGDADKILFWYRPEGATQYRALYGDLHAADVTEDKLPEKPKP